MFFQEREMSTFLYTRAFSKNLLLCIQYYTQTTSFKGIKKHQRIVFLFFNVFQTVYFSKLVQTWKGFDGLVRGTLKVILHRNSWKILLKSFKNMGLVYYLDRTRMRIVVYKVSYAKELHRNGSNTSVISYLVMIFIM